MADAAQNVFGTKSSDDPNINAQDMGRGFNTEMTMKSLDANRAMYERDKGVEEMYHQMPQPETPYPGSMPSNIDYGLEK
jgi:hypothetical protein